MSILPFNSYAEWLEYLREHDPAQYARLKEDQERSRLERLKQEKPGEWVGAVTSGQLRDELRSLKSRRIALEREKPELIGRAGWPLQGPLGKQYAEVIHYIEVLKAELIRRGEALDTAEVSAGPSADTTEGKPVDRRAMVDAYIEEVRSKKNKRITRKDIWSAAGYRSRAEFERWQRRDPKRPNQAADENFTRILREKPHLK